MIGLREGTKSAMFQPRTFAIIGGIAAFLFIILALQDRGTVPSFEKLTKPAPSISPTPQSAPLTSSGSSGAWEFVSERDERNLGLDEDQCQSAFPKQYVEIERAAKWQKENGGITLDKIALMKDEPDKAHGQVRILIFNGNLYVVGEKQGVVDRTRYLSGLSMIYRAITSIPDPRVIPNVEFTLDRMDLPNLEPHRPGRIAWAWCRNVKDNDTWVMPDFNGWASSAWEEVGGYRALREKSARYLNPFKDKIKKAIWRGQLNVGQKISEPRKKLLAASKDKPWSDISEIHWNVHTNTVPMDQHCKWQFGIHTEGNSWSGRLRPLKNCNTVTVIHNPLQYIAHFYPVLQPDGPEQNYVAVKNDWSDLDEKITYLLKNQDEAEAIAERSREVFRDRYLTPAAEACYIRRMIYEWKKVQNFEPVLFKNITEEDGAVVEKMRGYSWESFAWRKPKPFNIPPPPKDYFFKSNQIDFED